MAVIMIWLFGGTNTKLFNDTVLLCKKSYSSSPSGFTFIGWHERNRLGKHARQCCLVVYIGLHSLSRCLLILLLSTIYGTEWPIMCWCAVKKLLTLSRCHSSFFWLQDATCVQKHTHTHTQSYTVKQSLSRWNVGRSVAYLLWRLTDAVPNASQGNCLLNLMFVFIPRESLVAAHRFDCIGSLTSVVYPLQVKRYEYEYLCVLNGSMPVISPTVRGVYQ